jgi:hypothetical protein
MATRGSERRHGHRWLGRTPRVSTWVDAEMLDRVGRCFLAARLCPLLPSLYGGWSGGLLRICMGMATRLVGPQQRQTPPFSPRAGPFPLSNSAGDPPEPQSVRSDCPIPPRDARSVSVLVYAQGWDRSCRRIRSCTTISGRRYIQNGAAFRWPSRRLPHGPSTVMPPLPGAGHRRELTAPAAALQHSA